MRGSRYFRGRHVVARLALAVLPALSAAPLKVGYGNMSPMCYRDTSGHAQGFAVEALNEAAAQIGATIHTEPGRVEIDLDR